MVLGVVLASEVLSLQVGLLDGVSEVSVPDQKRFNLSNMGSRVSLFSMGLSSLAFIRCTCMFLYLPILINGFGISSTC